MPLLQKGFVPHRDWHQQTLSDTERLRPSGRHRPLCPSRTDGTRYVPSATLCDVVFRSGRCR
ncbi:unnamed protein product [Ixodes pacificus]